MKAVLTAVLAMVVAIGFSQPVLANVMTFEDVGYVSSYSQNGINFTGNGGDWYVGTWGDASTPNLHTHGGTGRIDMGGALFSLSSLDLNTNYSSWTITSSTGAVYAFPYEDWGAGFTHLDFTNVAGFSGITSFTFSNGNNCFGIDNVDLTAGSPAVPEPSTFLLLGAGLAGVGFIRRKTKK